MARKSKKLVNRAKVWNPDDVIQLLAWMDHVRHEINFKATVVNHLKATTQKLFDWEQIRGKLWREWDKFGVEGSKSTDMYHQGISCLKYLPPKKKEQILEVVSRLGVLSPRYRLRSASSVIPSVTSTLSSLHTTPEVQTPDRHYDFHIVRLTTDVSSSSINQRETSRNLEIETSASSKSPVQSENVRGGAIWLSDGTGGANEVRAVKGETTPEGATYSHTSSRITTNESQDLIVSARRIAEDEEPRVRLLEKEVEEKVRQLAEREAKIMAQKNQIDNLTTRLSSVCKENDALQHSIRAGEAHDSNLLRKLRYENFVVRQQLLNAQSIRKDVESLKTGSLGPPDHEIRSDLDKLEGQIADASSSLRNAHLPLVNIEIMPEQSSHIESLVSRICGLKIDQLRSYVSDYQIPKLELLRSISAACICASVFESAFPDFLAVESPLLDQYRKHILTRDGIRALQHLDLLVHKSLVSQSYFESHVIVSMAQELAAKLSEILDPFLALSSDTIDARSAQEGQNLEDQDLAFNFPSETSLAEFFQGAFVRALELKAKLLLSGKRYQLIFFQPKSEFNPETMKQDGWNYDGYAPMSRGGKSSLSSDTSGGKVKLCLFPALYSYSQPEAEQIRNIEAGIGEFVVDYRSFITDGSRNDLPGHVLIAKAVVLV